MLFRSKFFARADHENGEQQNDEVAFEREKVAEALLKTHIWFRWRLHSASQNGIAKFKRQDSMSFRCVAAAVSGGRDFGISADEDIGSYNYASEQASAFCSI